ncbi:MAG: hypothetical protein AAF975_02100, partial [Spirochaetota bacterium]
MYELTTKEIKAIEEIEASYYMQPSLALINNKRKQAKIENEFWRELFNGLYSLLIDSKESVDKLLHRRLKNGEIKDISQARKSIAGNAFAKLLVYVFIQNKVCGNIRPDIL